MSGFRQRTIPMEISITMRFARNGKADENNTRQIKKALNRLGYYMPAAKQGITEIPDEKFKSTGHFNVRRSGDIILIQSNIVHSMDDVYNFNDDTLLDHYLFNNERLLAEKGYATPFKVHWKKIQNVTGKIIIKTMKLETSISNGWMWISKSNA